MPWPKPDLWRHGYVPASDRCQATGGPGDFTATGPAPVDRCLYPPTKVVVGNIVTFPPRNCCPPPSMRMAATLTVGSEEGVRPTIETTEVGRVKLAR